MLAETILLRAAEIIESAGKIEYQVGDPENGCCIRGAMHWAERPDGQFPSVYRVNAYSPELHRAYDLVRKALGLPDVPEDRVMEADQVAHWNNDPEVTTEQVARALRHAAALAITGAGKLAQTDLVLQD